MLNRQNREQQAEQAERSRRLMELLNFAKQGVTLDPKNPEAAIGEVIRLANKSSPAFNPFKMGRGMVTDVDGTPTYGEISDLPKDEDETVLDEWSSPGTSSPFVTRTGPGGELQQRENPNYIEPGEDSDMPKSGVRHMEYGSVYEQGGERIFVPVGTDELSARRAHVAEKLTQETAEWQMKHGYKVDLINIRYAHDDAVRTQNASSKIGAEVTALVQDGLITVEEGKKRILSAMLELDVEDPERHVRAYAPLLDHNELKVPWTVVERTNLVSGNAGIAHAEAALEMLKDDNVGNIVWREVGSLKGLTWMQMADEVLKGGAGRYSAPTRKFLTYLSHLKDTIQRDRSGAALTPSEQEFYNVLIGTALTDPGELKQRIETYAEYEQDYLNSFWDTKLRIKYGQDTSGYLKAKEIYNSNEARVVAERRMLGDTPTIEVGQESDSSLFGE
jgi:hypothetical protein